MREKKTTVFWVSLFDVIIGLKKITDDMKTHKNPQLKLQGLHIKIIT